MESKLVNSRSILAREYFQGVWLETDRPVMWSEIFFSDYTCPRAGSHILKPSCNYK